MKKRYILIPFLIISLVLFYLLNKKDIVNYTYMEDNIDINFPYFNNKELDNYINNYVNDIITSFKYNKTEGYLIMDYDYIDNTNLTFYKYQNINNIISIKEDNLYIDNNVVKVINANDIDIEKENDIIQNSLDNSNSKMIALTFDDGPNYNTSKMIDVLNKYNVKATFFIVGSRIKGNEKIIKKLSDNDMEIGNHTYSHKLLTNLTKDKIIEQIAKTNNLIFEITGYYPKLLRPSYGSTNRKIRSLSDMPIIIWNVDTLDWKYHNSKTIASKIISKAKDGNIILMHDVYSATVNAVDIAIPKLIKEGYKIVTVSELFYYKNIELEKGKVYGSA